MSTDNDKKPVLWGDHGQEWVIQRWEYGRRTDPITGEQWSGHHEFTLTQPGGAVRAHGYGALGLCKVLARFAGLRPSDDTPVIYKMECHEPRRKSVVYNEEWDEYTWGDDPVTVPPPAGT